LQARAPSRNAAVISHGVVPVSDFVDISPGRKARACRHADRARRVCGGEAGAARRERVGVWRPHDGMARAWGGAGLVVVGNDEQEILSFHESDHRAGFTAISLVLMVFPPRRAVLTRAARFAA